MLVFFTLLYSTSFIWNFSGYSLDRHCLYLTKISGTRFLYFVQKAKPEFTAAAAEFADNNKERH
jgi:hypothetical protein